MKSTIISILMAVLCIGFSGCRSQQLCVPAEISKVDSISQKSEILVQRVQNLINEIRIWEQRRDSISARDSIAVKDSTVLYINEAGDVVSKERYRDRIQKSDRTSLSENNRQTEISRQYIDSLLTAQKNELMAMMENSQQVPIPVERKLTKWEQLKQEVGGISIGILVVIVVIAVIWLIKKIKNQK
ncbi:MAG: hypothetical protein HDR88_04440 [Bacteroides sp.]|nr:hypothetical protein [Bacteroides sp.]